MRGEQQTIRRCAIYTRKSSEEGLEQAFNSLDAQHEACTAYIDSQKHEGWRVISTHYDDGGYSGGSLVRPALTRLLADIDAGKIDAVVVYKVDRLTRSLADFAKIVETFDARDVSFVSVTQQFNTTTSMGRLTLNVLLSFAQFEREVTGERIRDKFAASKKKGMWMGGNVPLGYDVRERKLVIHPAEAELVRWIYRRYAELGNVSSLKQELDERGYVSKARTNRNGKTTGGHRFYRGALYTILHSRLYRGEVSYGGQVYRGEHEAIVEDALWDRVQTRLTASKQARRDGVDAIEASLLAGMLYDEQGNRFTPSHAVKNGKRYRYYVSQGVIRQRDDRPPRPARIPAHEVEELVSRRVRGFLNTSHEVLDVLLQPGEPAAMQDSLVAAAKEFEHKWIALAPSEQRVFLRTALSRIVIQEDRIALVLSTSTLRGLLCGAIITEPAPNRQPHGVDEVTLWIEAGVKRCGGEVRMIVHPGASPELTRARPNASLIRSVALAHSWYDRLITGEVRLQQAFSKELGVKKNYVSRLMRHAFLAPDIVETILAGRQPSGVTLDKLLSDLPMEWAAQRKILGFPSLDGRAIT
jgi:site-specific DNA recombinase